MNYIILPREQMNDDDEVYQQYWTEFHAYYTFKGISPEPLGTPENDQRVHYFIMESFDQFQISFSVFLLGGSAISANLNLNKQVDKSQKFLML